MKTSSQVKSILAFSIGILLLGFIITCSNNNETPTPPTPQVLGVTFEGLVENQTIMTGGNTLTYTTTSSYDADTDIATITISIPEAPTYTGGQTGALVTFNATPSTGNLEVILCNSTSPCPHELGNGSFVSFGSGGMTGVDDRTFTTFPGSIDFRVSNILKNAMIQDGHSVMVTFTVFDSSLVGVVFPIISVSVNIALE